MQVLTVEQKEADLILKELIDNDYTFVHIDNIHIISCKNPNYKPDNGLNPRIACTIEELIGAMQRNNKVEDWSLINEAE